MPYTVEGNMREATPRPWRVNRNIGRKGELGVTADDAPCIIAVMGNAKAWPVEAEANAELIVRAVNSFDALVAVAHDAVANQSNRIEGATCPACGRDNSKYDNLCTADDCPGVMARTALKLAEGRA